MLQDTATPYLRAMTQSWGAQGLWAPPCCLTLLLPPENPPNVYKVWIHYLFSTQVQQFCFPFGSAQVLIWYLETGVRHKLLKSFLCALPIIEKVLTLFYFKTEEVLFDHQIYKTRLFSTQTVSGVKALLLNDIVSFIVHFFKHWTLETYMPQETCYPKKEQLKIQAVISSFKTWHLEMEYALLCNPFAFCCIVQWRKVQHHFGQGHIYSRVRYFNSFWVFTPWFLSITNTFRAALVAETAQNPRFNPS